MVTKKPSIKKWGEGWNPRMRIKKNHYIKLEKAIHKILKAQPKAYEENQRNGWTNTKFNWDLFYATGGGWRGVWSGDELYYLLDKHINTALQKITGKKGKLR